jgi:hypothetical protein
VSGDGALFEFVDGKEWKERGRGELRINFNQLTQQVRGAGACGTDDVIATAYTPKQRRDHQLFCRMVLSNHIISMVLATVDSGAVICVSLLCVPLARGCLKWLRLAPRNI